MTKVYNRKLKKYEEIKHFGGNALEKVYSSRILTYILTSKFISKVYGLYNSNSLSKKNINSFIKENNIDITKYEKEDYKNFNEFFIRKKKNINIDSNKKHLISPVDGKLLVYKVDNKKIKVKIFTYTLDELFDTNVVDNFKNGYIMVFRLSVDNYHRFHYIDDGVRLERKRIKGKLHTVSSSSDKYKIFKENEREYSILDTNNFGIIYYMEVGAMLIGRIINYDKDRFSRGEEKGYFLPGGSTVILLVNNVKIDKDILDNSKDNIEVLVEVGQRVGVLND